MLDLIIIGFAGLSLIATVATRTDNNIISQEEQRYTFRTSALTLSTVLISGGINPRSKSIKSSLSQDFQKSAKKTNKLPL